MLAVNKFLNKIYREIETSKNLHTHTQKNTFPIICKFVSMLIEITLAENPSYLVSARQDTILALFTFLFDRFGQVLGVQLPGQCTSNFFDHNKLIVQKILQNMMCPFILYNAKGLRYNNKKKEE